MTYVIMCNSPGFGDDVVNEHVITSLTEAVQLAAQWQDESMAAAAKYGIKPSTYWVEEG